MTTKRLAIAADTYIDPTAPSTNFGSVSRLWMGRSTQTLMMFALPFPRGAIITRARLCVFNVHNLPSGTRTITVQRVAGSWSNGTITWNRRGEAPTIGTPVTYTTTTTRAGSLWDIDVQPLMQAVSDRLNGGVWQGIRLTLDGTLAIAFHSANSTTVALRPYLEVEWSDQPATPIQLHPAGGRWVSDPTPVLACDYVDYGGSVRCAGMQAKIFTTEAAARTNGGEEWDSGEALVDDPQLDTGALGYPGVPSGEVRWWRCRVRDGAGLWSDWSAPASFGFAPLPQVTITTPTAATIEDVSPVVMWTAPNQTAYRVMLQDGSGRTLHDTGRLTSTQQAITAAKVISTNGQQLAIVVQVWDSAQREQLPGAPACGEAVWRGAYQFGGSITAPTALTVAQADTSPPVTLTWTVDNVPDAFVILRDDTVVARLNPIDCQVSGTTFTWVDPQVSAGRMHTWGVQSIVNGWSSQPRTASMSIDATGVWVIDPTGVVGPVRIKGVDGIEHGLTEQSTWHRPIGAPPVLITQSLGGNEGSIDGRLDASAIPGVTGRDLRDRMLATRSRPGVERVLFLGDLSLRVTLSNISVSVRDDPQRDRFGVKFTWVER